MNFLKRVVDEIIATIKPSVLLLISVIIWLLSKIIRLPKTFRHPQYFQLLKIAGIPMVFLFSISFCLYLSFFATTVISGQRPWSSLGTPPEMPTEIIAANHTDILVKTGNGKNYRCTYNQNELGHIIEPIRPGVSCWQETSETTLEEYGSSYFIYGISKKALSWRVKKPGKAIDTLSFTLTFIDTGYSRSHIIDEAGEVWVQEVVPWSAPDPKLIIPLITGGVGGIFLGIIILTWFKLKQAPDLDLTN
jgi:hypothetical protein